VTIYPKAEEIILVHARLIAAFGGSLGLRDRGALEAAIARPQSGYYQDVIQQAAAMWGSLSQNHPFVDGNQCVAVTVTAAFLKVNGHELDFDDLEAYSRLMELYETGKMCAAELDQWLRAHVRS
jgi:death-on-curing protein